MECVTTAVDNNHTHTHTQLAREAHATLESISDNLEAIVVINQALNHLLNVPCDTLAARVCDLNNARTKKKSTVYFARHIVQLSSSSGRNPADKSTINSCRCFTYVYIATLHLIYFCADIKPESSERATFSL